MSLFLLTHMAVQQAEGLKKLKHVMIHFDLKIFSFIFYVCMVFEDSLFILMRFLMCFDRLYFMTYRLIL